MRWAITGVLALGVAGTVFADDGLTAKAELDAYNACGKTYLDNLYSPTEQPNFIADAVLTKCSVFFGNMQIAMTEELREKAKPTTIEGQQRADKWAAGGADARRKALRDWLISEVIARRANAPAK